jgi:hypothetical protein
MADSTAPERKPAGRESHSEFAPQILDRCEPHTVACTRALDCGKQTARILGRAEQVLRIAANLSRLAMVSGRSEERPS